jgi:hypothetical protein
MGNNTPPVPPDLARSVAVLLEEANRAGDHTAELTYEYDQWFIGIQTENGVGISIGMNVTT